MAIVCSSCNKETGKGAVEFNCPGCGARIVRCEHCRKTVKVYKCNECGFTGP